VHDSLKIRGSGWMVNSWGFGAPLYNIWYSAKIFVCVARSKWEWVFWESATAILNVLRCYLYPFQNRLRSSYS
jgi:hypothetical protein